MNKSNKTNLRPKKTTRKEQELLDQQNLEHLKKRDSLLVVESSFLNAAVTETFGKSLLPNMDISKISDNIRQSVRGVQNGNLEELEDMLVGQAKSLETMFANLARRANAQEYLQQFTTYMNLALKTQAQSRATIQAIVELKYPRQVVVTQQANFSAGHQQVNNGATQRNFDANTHAHAPTHAEKNQNEPNKLMESNHENTIEVQDKRLDTRTTGKTINSDTPLETVATVHRGKNT